MWRRRIEKVSRQIRGVQKPIDNDQKAVFKEPT